MTDRIDCTGSWTAADLAPAVEALRAGLAVAVPTDTVYGVAVDPFVAGAVDRLFEMKGRDRTKPIAVLVCGVDGRGGAARLADLSDAAAELAARSWPGALTLVCPRRPDVAIDLGEPPNTVGVRHPDHPVPQALIAAVGPLATTSANRTGEPELTTADAIADRLGDHLAVIIDGGAATGGAASTVVDVTSPEPRVLRPGPIEI